MWDAMLRRLLAGKSGEGTTMGGEGVRRGEVEVT
jgi:hypothetical protein